ncbi:DoxX family membrane protein [Candidatus Woesearchaeota archaeon]|nr:DoxX family membrane protein [Candidatus Woesearchaeota archaeon]
MFKNCEEYGPFVLRLFFGIAFIVAGLDKIFSYSMAKGMFEMLFGGAGGVMLILAILIELIAGTSLLIGFHTRYAAALLALFILVAFIQTFKLGAVPHFIGTLREIMVMNTGGGNTAVNFAYFATLLSLALTGSKFKAVKPD